MPPQPPLPPLKPYFFYGHRKPSQNRPTVYGGLFSNLQSLKNPDPTPHLQSQPFDIQKWDPHYLPSQTRTRSPPSITPLSISQRLSPIARFIIDSFRKNQYRWGPEVLTQLQKLRRVTPDLVAEVLKVENNPVLASKFFHWAGKQKGYRHTFSSYNALAYCLHRNKLFRAADQVPELMEAQGKPPTEKQFEILIRMHSDCNRGNRVYYVYQKMKKFGVVPRVFLYNKIMDVLVRTNCLDLALSVYEDFKGHGLIEESVTYMILIKGLCKAGRVSEMFEILEKMRGNLCKPDVFAYTAMLRVLVWEGNLDACWRVWEEMRKDLVEPDVMAYVTLIMGFCKGGRVERGYELFREMKEKGVLIDRAIYGVLVDGFVGEGKVGKACDLLKDLVDSGYRADLGIYNSIIGGLCSIKRVDKAYKLFEITVQEGIEPDFSTVNPLLVCYAEMRRMDDFCKLLMQMEKLRFCVVDDLEKFFELMVGKEEKINVALEVFEELKGKGYGSVSIYNILMGTLHKVGEVKKALSLFDEMKDLNLELNPSTYSIAIQCFVDSGDVQEACTCHNKIVEMSHVPSVDAYSSLARGLCKIGEIDVAMMLVHDCLGNVTTGPMEFKYTLTIIHMCRSRDAEKVIEVLNEMMEEGCALDAVICSAIIYGMCKYGTLEEARKVFTHLSERKLLTEANTIVYDEILIEHMKKKTADLVLLGLKFFGLESKLKAKGSRLLSS
ncbi:pentatricopeptide repeat-containing protein At4g20740 [Mangifera indica]|uniref:pentatricopeptide repeat-containing protein At4g20740 n=1 Tax=Mangifera indica TaxID=29780 RepID=UPI001CFB0498|nr:pentatricopeptide repeat-containing protein At4g20740 [Mangifera indica]XP_044488169.1 pentatricopeptide repeat-containing protein At4g20740 [Mangifera indica]